MGRISWERLAALAALAFVLLYVAAFTLGIEVGNSDREILDYYASSGHRAKEVVAFFNSLATEEAGNRWLENVLVQTGIKSDPSRIAGPNAEYFRMLAAANQGAFAKDKLKGFARDVGLDTAAFDSCLDANKYLDQVRKDFQEGQRVGVQSTPAFLVNDQRVLGAQPFQAFARVIDQELAKKR